MIIYLFIWFTLDFGIKYAYYISIFTSTIYFKSKFVQYIFLKCYLLNYLSVENIPFAFLAIKRFVCKVFWLVQKLWNYKKLCKARGIFAIIVRQPSQSSESLLNSLKPLVVGTKQGLESFNSLQSLSIPWCPPIVCTYVMNYSPKIPNP